MNLLSVYQCLWLFSVYGKGCRSFIIDNKAKLLFKAHILQFKTLWVAGAGRRGHVLWDCLEVRRPGGAGPQRQRVRGAGGGRGGKSSERSRVWGVGFPSGAMKELGTWDGCTASQISLTPLNRTL